ncbi:unnamed protein product [Arctogadus glacialis]
MSERSPVKGQAAVRYHLAWCYHVACFHTLLFHVLTKLRRNMAANAVSTTLGGGAGGPRGRSAWSTGSSQSPWSMRSGVQQSNEINKSPLFIKSVLPPRSPGPNPPLFQYRLG